MNIYSLIFFCRIYGYLDTESVCIRALSVIRYFPLLIIYHVYLNMCTNIKYYD